MALPPPPRSTDITSRVWLEWYNNLYKSLNSVAGAIAWAVVDKTGSALADLASRPHSALTSVLGNGTLHLSVIEQSQHYLQSKAGDPTTTDIAAGSWSIYKNTSTGAVKLWVNDSGTMKSVTLV